MDLQYGDVYLDTTDDEVFILIKESDDGGAYITLPIAESREKSYRVGETYLKNWCEYKGNISKPLTEFADLVRSTVMKKIFLVLLMVLMIPSLAHALTTEQEDILDMAKMYGEGVGMPETIQSIVLQESSAGAGGKIGDDGSSVGIMQMSPYTAQYVARKYQYIQELTPEQHATALFNNDYALLTGALYFKECYDKFKKYKGHWAWRYAVVCYNAGMTGAERMSKVEINTHPYLQKIRERLQFVREYREDERIQRTESKTNPVHRI